MREPKDGLDDPAKRHSGTCESAREGESLAAMTPISHVASYRFVELQDLPGRRAAITAAAKQEGLIGIVLLAHEGINACVAGEEEGLVRFFAWLEEDPCFAGIEKKWSTSAEPPYGKLRVKLKNEIVRMDHPEIQPGSGRAASVESGTLRRWLDQGHDDAGREVVMLDTRNAFELEYGAFEGAIDLGLKSFSLFPEAMEARRAEVEGKTVVAYCTGGIRCEKAVLQLEKMGIANVHQLEGGILRYFQREGEAHYRGGCFVFDRRISLKASDMLPE